MCTHHSRADHATSSRSSPTPDCQRLSYYTPRITKLGRDSFQRSIEECLVANLQHLASTQREHMYSDTTRVVENRETRL